MRQELEYEAPAVSFDYRVTSYKVEEDCTTLELEFVNEPERDTEEVSDEWLTVQRAWFAGLNGEIHANEGLRLAVWGDDGKRWRVGQRLRFTLEIVP